MAISRNVTYICEKCGFTITKEVSDTNPFGDFDTPNVCIRCGGKMSIVGVRGKIPQTILKVVLNLFKGR